MHRYLPYCVWHCNSGDTFPLFRWSAQIAIAPQFHPMSLCHYVKTNTIAAILAPRLLQAACNIAYSLLRLITSDNDIASIMESMCVSISHASLANLPDSSILSSYILCATLHAGIGETILSRHAARIGKAWAQGISFSIGWQGPYPSTPPCPLAHVPMRKPLPP